MRVPHASGRRWAVGAGMVLVTLWASTAWADGRSYSCVGGDTPCLVAAMRAAQATPGPHVIRLGAGEFTLAAAEDAMAAEGGTGLPVVTSDVRIRGAGASHTTVIRSATAPVFRLFRVAAGGRLRLEGLAVKGGSGGILSGGGLLNAGTLVLEGVLVANNIADRGAGIYSTGTLRILDSEIAHNSAGHPAGALANFGSLTVRRSTIHHNSADGAAGIHNAGRMVAQDVIIRDNVANSNAAFANLPGADGLIERSTIADNRGGNVAGGAMANGGTLVIRGSTIVGNELVAGVAGKGVVSNSGVLRLRRTTLADNRSSAVSGVPAVIQTLPSGVTEIAGSIIDRNGSLDLCAGAIASKDHNVFGNTNGCNLQLRTHDRVGSADLASRRDGVVPLTATSQAIDIGGRCPVLDQIGSPRMDGDGDGSVACDGGAVEFIAHPVTVLVAKPWPHGGLSGERGHVGGQGEGHGLLLLDVLGSPAFDVRDIDKATVRAGRTGHETRALSSHLLDVNHDGVPDRRFGFQVEQLGLLDRTSTVSLTGATPSGETVAGTAVLERTR